MNLEDEIRRGHEAERLLTHPLLVEAFTTIEANLLSALRVVPLTDSALERETVRTIQVLHKVRGHIENVATTGKMAEAQKESMAKRVLRAVRG